MLRVMLIDDEENALDFLEILLREIGRTEIAGRYRNAVEALQALQSQSVDAVFLDIEMPGLSGMEAAERLRERDPHVQIVFTTAYAEHAAKAFDLRSTDYLLKPFTKERLNDSLDRIVLSKKSFGPREPAVEYPQIRCLGGFNIQLNGLGERLPWRTNKEKELCALLVHHEGRQIETAAVLEALWPEYDLNKSKTYLYTCISFLRKSFHKYGIPMSVNKVEKGYAISLGALRTDAARLEELLRAANGDAPLDDRLYSQLNGLYGGAYMGDCGYDWAQEKQAALASRYVAVLRLFYAGFQGREDAESAEDALERIVASQPDSEEDGRELIRLYMDTRRRNKAIKACRQLIHNVRSMLGVEPEEATMRLYQDLMTK